ncbi:hypothetical protein scyTo_0020620 [Scyliorhinus torazame]|uniref:Uncharacterized protein n=1 Tax=Scyliorhinus torazame TaxID=75743 RepID=A0A401PXL2_SCYTO|nr:hypothetical protein [Scyliorhinus torazame]
MDRAFPPLDIPDRINESVVPEDRVAAMGLQVDLAVRRHADHARLDGFELLISTEIAEDILGTHGILRGRGWVSIGEVLHNLTEDRVLGEGRPGAEGFPALRAFESL